MAARSVGWAAALAMAAAAGLVGCGGGDGLNRVEIRGTVSFDGAPLETGSIAFIPDGGTSAPSVGGAIKDGKFHLPRAQGPVVGTYKVMIQASRKTGRQIVAGEGANDPNAMVDEVEMFIPEKYNSKTELTAQVGPDTGPLAFDLLGQTEPK